MADDKNVWTQDIEDEELSALLTKAATTGHPEWDYAARHGVMSGKMSEKQAVAYLKDCFDPDVDDDDEDDAPAPKAAAKK